MPNNDQSICPGCGLSMPKSGLPTAHGYYNASSECWSVYTEVLESEFSNAVLFGQVHQLTVDTYAVQHAGGPHPDKSVDIHLAGLLLVLDRGVRPTAVPPNLQRLASTVKAWPHFTPPENLSSFTVFDVALSGTLEEHVHAVREWSASVWKAWSHHHSTISAFLDSHLTSPIFR